MKKSYQNEREQEPGMWRHFRQGNFAYATKKPRSYDLSGTLMQVAFPIE